MAEFDQGRKWQWKALPALPVRSREEAKGATALKLLVPFAIAGLLWLWGKLVFAAVIAGIGLLLLGLRYGALPLYELIHTAFAALGRWLGKVVSNALLSAVYVLVFVPAALLGRLLRRDGLSLGREASSRTYWLVSPKVDPLQLFNQPFLLEAMDGKSVTGSAKVFRSVRALYRAALTLFVLNLALGYAGHQWKEYQREGEADPRSQLEAYRNLDWSREYFREERQGNVREYWPYVAWKQIDYKGRYVNIENAHRKTYQAATDSRPTLSLYAFGASTTYGMGARDEQTIPSYLAKAAERDGIPLRVENFAQTAFVNWQNVVRLSELCADGDVPDFVTFYTGAGDALAKVETPDMKRPLVNIRILKERFEARSQGGTALLWLEHHSLLHIIGRKLAEWTRSGAGGDEVEAADPELVKRLANELVTAMEDNVAFVRKLEEVCGFEAFYFWQPVMYTKKNLSPAERAEYQADQAIPTQVLVGAVYREATQEVQSRDFAIDISDAFDPESGTIFFDWAHAVERGNELVAERMYRHIKPALQRRYEPLRVQEASR